MSNQSEVVAAAARQPKGLTRVVLGLFTKQATVTEIRALDERFHLLTLQGPALQGVQWEVGQKVQIMLGSAFVARTYTPLEWDAQAGRTRLLVYAHGSSLGSDWVRGLKVGDAVQVFGPRASLDIGRIAGPIVVLGDETSIGLTYAIQNQYPERALLSLLEVNTKANTAAVLAQLGVGTVELFERREDGEHLRELEQHLAALSQSEATFVLSGQAGSIQALRRTLKSLGVPGARLPTKAYWAPGKRGLD